MNAGGIDNLDEFNYCMTYIYNNDKLKIENCDFCVFFTQHMHDYAMKSCECGVSITQWKKSGLISMVVDEVINWPISI